MEGSAGDITCLEPMVDEMYTMIVNLIVKIKGWEDCLFWDYELTKDILYVTLKQVIEFLANILEKHDFVLWKFGCTYSFWLNL